MVLSARVSVFERELMISDLANSGCHWDGCLLKLDSVRCNSSSI